MSDQPPHAVATREALSAMVDGQARPDELTHVLSVWKGDGETQATWRDYQFVGDVMRSADLAHGTDGDRFLHKLRNKLADEPVVFAPRLSSMTSSVDGASSPAREAGLVQRHRWAPLAVAAGFVMLVGGMVSVLGPDASLPADSFASSDARVQSFAQASDPPAEKPSTLPVAAGLLPTTTLISAHAPMFPIVASGDSFSRSARWGDMFIREPAVAPALLLHDGQQIHEHDGLDVMSPVLIRAAAPALP